MSATTRPLTTDDKVLYSGPTPEIDGKTGVVVGRWTEDESVIDVDIDGDRWSVHASRLTLVEQDDDLDAPVPYVPVSLPGIDMPSADHKAIVDAVARIASSSQAGVAAHRYSPTRFGALIPSGGVRMHPKPASSDDTKPARTFGYNIVTVHPDGRHGGPRLTNAVTREEALAELDELAPFMVDGYTTVLVELREVAR